MWHFKVTDKSYVKTYVGITGELLRKLTPKLKKKNKPCVYTDILA